MSVLDRIGDALRTWVGRSQEDAPEPIRSGGAFTAFAHADEADRRPSWMGVAASESRPDESTIPTIGHSEDYEGRYDSNGWYAEEQSRHDATVARIDAVLAENDEPLIRNDEEARRPWEASSMSELARNYGEDRSDDISWDRIDRSAAEDWLSSLDAPPEDGARAWPSSEYFYRDGKLWGEGRYLGPNGENDPYEVSSGWGEAWGAADRSPDSGDAPAPVGETTARIATAEEKSPAQVEAEGLKAEYFRQMTIENTPLGFYDDRYDMDDFPEEVDPARSDVAERALLQHLREHPELRENPEWADWYEGVDETAGDEPPADEAAGGPSAPAGAPPGGGNDRDHAQAADEINYYEDEHLSEVAAATQETAESVEEACAAVDEALTSPRVPDEALRESTADATADAASDC
jgi:hypothetical protein